MKGKTDKQGERKGGKTVSAERREEILRRIRSVMTEETPDLWEKIDRRLGPRDEAAKKVSGRRRFPAARIAAAAACLLLCVSAAAGGVLVWNHFENGLSAAGSRESDVSSAAPYLFIVYSRASMPAGRPPGRTSRSSSCPRTDTISSARSATLGKRRTDGNIGWILISSFSLWGIQSNP